VLRSHGMDFIGCTPCMSAMHGNRPIEILRWMRAHNKKATEEEGGEEKVSEWVAVDDRMLLGEKQGIKLEGHFVHTHPRQGLTQAAANQCIAILNGEGPQVAKAATSRKPALSASGWLPSARRAEVRSERAEEKRSTLTPGQAAIMRGKKINSTVTAEIAKSAGNILPSSKTHPKAKLDPPADLRVSGAPPVAANIA